MWGDPLTTAIEVKTCLHDARGVCWLCSNQDPRWREWRMANGLPVEPPNAAKSRMPALRPTMTEIEVDACKVAISRPSVELVPERNLSRPLRRTAPRIGAPGAPMKPVEPGKWADVYAYWDAHPKLTLAEAERAVRRLQKAAG